MICKFNSIPIKISMPFFVKIDKTVLQFMRLQKTMSNHINPEKGEASWRHHSSWFQTILQSWRHHTSWFQILLQSYSNQKSTYWHKTYTQSNETEQWNKSKHILSTDLWQGCQKMFNEERVVSLTNVLGILDIHM